MSETRSAPDGSAWPAPIGVGGVSSRAALDLARLTVPWMGLLRILARSCGPRTQATGNPSRERTDNRRHTHRLGICVALEHR
jgi:hypothetical protein